MYKTLLWCVYPSSHCLVLFWETQLDTFRKCSGGTCLPLHWQSSNSCDNNDIYFYWNYNIISSWRKKVGGEFIKPKSISQHTNKMRDSTFCHGSVFIAFIKMRLTGWRGKWLSRLQREKSKRIRKMSEFYVLKVIRFSISLVKCYFIFSCMCVCVNIEHSNRIQFSILCYPY